MVFSDKTLRAIIDALPADRAGLLACKGVGERKAEEYGGDVLRVIRGFMES
jgi:superfamily II DNA helicase RecQ